MVWINILQVVGYKKFNFNFKKSTTILFALFFLKIVSCFNDLDHLTFIENCLKVFILVPNEPQKDCI